VIAEVALEIIWTAQQFRRFRLSTPQFFFWQRVPRILV
jgi:hypothetical protein